MARYFNKSTGEEIEAVQVLSFNYNKVTAKTPFHNFFSDYPYWLEELIHTNKLKMIKIPETNLVGWEFLPKNNSRLITIRVGGYIVKSKEDFIDHLTQHIFESSHRPLFDFTQEQERELNEAIAEDSGWEYVELSNGDLQWVNEFSSVDELDFTWNAGRIIETIESIPDLNVFKIEKHVNIFPDSYTVTLGIKEKCDCCGVTKEREVVETAPILALALCYAYVELRGIQGDWFNES